MFIDHQWLLVWAFNYFIDIYGGKSNFNKTMNMVLLRRICQHGQPGRCLSVEDIHSHLSRKSPRVSNRGLKGLFQEVPQYFMIDYGTFGTPNMHFRILTEFLTEFIQFRNAPLQPSCCTNITSAVLLGHHLQNNTSMVLEKTEVGRKEIIRWARASHATLWPGGTMTNMYISSCLPFFRFNIPSPTKIVISLCSKLKVCLESTKQHQRLLCRKRKYTVTSMYMCYAVCVEACKYVYIYT